MKIAFIIQARKGSTRLPNKVVMPFYNQQGILEIILKRFKAFDKIALVLATTTNTIDDELVKLAEANSVNVFRGDEQDVLKRFIDCAKNNGIDVIIRVCADNPFLDVDYIQALVDEYLKAPKNYISYGMPDGTPTIKTHFGVFCELVELQSLIGAAEKTKEQLYHEHVTNFIYANPNLFSIKLIDVPEFLVNQKIRLTLDTIEDFEVLSDVYKVSMTKFGNVSIKNVLKIIEENPSVKEQMKKEIEKNTK